MNRLPLSHQVGAYVLLAITAWVVIGCATRPNNERRAVGIALQGAGTIMVVVPTGVSQVIGCTLIAGGTAILVEAEWNDGSRRSVGVPLPEWQQQRFKDKGVTEGTQGAAYGRMERAPPGFGDDEWGVVR